MNIKKAGLEGITKKVVDTLTLEFLQGVIIFNCLLRKEKCHIISACIRKSPIKNSAVLTAELS